MWTFHCYWIIFKGNFFPFLIIFRVSYTLPHEKFPEIQMYSQQQHTPSLANHCELYAIDSGHTEQRKAETQLSFCKRRCLDTSSPREKTSSLVQKQNCATGHQSSLGLGSLVCSCGAWSYSCPSAGFKGVLSPGRCDSVD